MLLCDGNRTPENRGADGRADDALAAYGLRILDLFNLIVNCLAEYCALGIMHIKAKSHPHERVVDTFHFT